MTQHLDDLIAGLLGRLVYRSLDGLMASQVTVDSLATLLSQTGETEESAQAEDLYRRAVDAKESALGKNHPSTLMSVHNLASLLVSYGEHMRPKNESQATLSRHRHHHNTAV